MHKVPKVSPGADDEVCVATAAIFGLRDLSTVQYNVQIPVCIPQSWRGKCMQQQFDLRYEGRSESL